MFQLGHSRMCDSLSCPWIWDRRTGLGGHAAWLDLLVCPGELHLLKHKRTGRPEPKPTEEPHQESGLGTPCCLRWAWSGSRRPAWAATGCVGSVRPPGGAPAGWAAAHTQVWGSPHKKRGESVVDPRTWFWRGKSPHSQHP